MKRHLIRAIALFGLLVMMVTPGLSWARQIDFVDAWIVGENFIRQIIQRQGGWGEAKEAYVLDCTEFKEEDSRLLGYFLPVHPRGYIIVSLLTQLPAVKAYSWENDLETAAQGGATRLLKDTMGSTIEYLEKVHGSLDRVPEEGVAPKSNREEWAFLSGSGPAPLDASGGTPDYVTTGPLTGTTWDQNGPFNDSCPNGDGGRTIVGCVATAACQIMKYWNYPWYGTGSHSYNWDGDNSCHSTPVGGGTLSVNFNHAYDWENMLNSYSGSYDATQAAAVAQLCYEVGVAFEMDYGNCSSGATTGDAATVFPTYFRYANTTATKYRPDYSADTWFAEIRKEFDNPLPRLIQYRIYRSGWGGHSIVCDGYQTGVTNYIHMNYGWAGSNNLWYAVDNLYCPDASNLCPTSDQYMVTGIQPKNRKFLVVKGATNNNIYYSYTVSGVFSQWYTMGGATSHAPAMVVFNNKQYTAVKGAANNNIYIMTRDYQNNWSPWTQIPGQTSTSPALAVFNNRLYLFVKGATNTNIYYKSMSASGTWDSSWSTVPSVTTSDTPVVAAFNNNLYLFVKGATNNWIYYTYMYDNGSWSGDIRIRSNGSTSVAPAVAVYNDMVYLFCKGSTNNNIYYVSSPVAGFPYWESWATLSGQTSTTPYAALFPQTNLLYVAVKGATNNNIYYRYYDPIDTTWTSWVALSGGTSDTPVLNTFYYNGE